jgi:predicted nucleic acid-binding protein
MIEPIFVDSFAWIAAINKSDNYHEISLRILEELLNKQAKLITTNYIVVETINALSKVKFRKTVIEFIDKLKKSPHVQIVKITDEIYNNAWTLYQQRMDKDWGITDCISFEVMQMFNIRKAFSSDKHFEQAGYSLMVK